MLGICLIIDQEWLELALIKGRYVIFIEGLEGVI